MKYVKVWPRRNSVNLWIPVERHTHDLVQEIEKLGCHTRLTDAVILLQQVRDAIADWAEETGNDILDIKDDRDLDYVDLKLKDEADLVIKVQGKEW